MNNNNLDPDDIAILNQGTREMEQFSSALYGQTSGSTPLEQAQRQEINNQAKKKQAQALRKMAREQAKMAVVGMVGQLVGNQGSFKPVTNAITTLGSAFSKLLSSFGPMGKLLGAVAEGATQAIGWILDTFEKNYESFEKLSGTGLVQTFEQLRDASLTTNLTVESLGKVLETQSKGLTLLGNNAVGGFKQFQQFATLTNNLRENYMMSGFSIEEFAKSQSEYLTLMARIGQNEQHDMKRSQQMFPEYLDNLLELSHLTGVSREELQKQFSDALSDARFRAWSVNQREEEILRVQSLVRAVEAIGGKQASKGLQDAISAGGNFAVGSEEFKKLLITYKLGNSDLLGMVQQFMNYNIDQAEFLTNYVGTMGNFADRYRPIVADIGDMKSTTSFAEAAKAGSFRVDLQSGKRTIDQLTDDQIKNLEAERQKNKNLAAARNNMNSMAVSINSALLNADFVSDGFRKITENIDKIIIEAEKIAEKYGGAKPTVSAEYKEIKEQQRLLYKVVDLEKARDRELATRQATLEKLEAARKKQADSATSSPTNAQLIKTLEEQLKTDDERIRREEHDLKITTEQLNELRKQQNLPPLTVEQATQLRTATTYAVSVEGAPSADGSERPNATVVDKLLNYIGKKESNGNYNILVGGRTLPDLTNMTVAQVLELQRSMINSRQFLSSAVGKYQIIRKTLQGLVKNGKVGLNETFSPQTQDRLAIALMEGRGLNKYLAGRMSSGNFADRLAMEWASLPYRTGVSYYQGFNSNKSLGSRQEFMSLFQGGKTGGLFRGPSSGYLTVMHGDEIVIPANDEITKQNLVNNITADENDQILIEMFTMIDQHVEKMIDLVSDTNTVQRLYSKMDG